MLYNVIINLNDKELSDENLKKFNIFGGHKIHKIIYRMYEDYEEERNRILFCDRRICDGYLVNIYCRRLSKEPVVGNIINITPIGDNFFCKRSYKFRLVFNPYKANNGRRIRLCNWDIIPKLEEIGEKNGFKLKSNCSILEQYRESFKKGGHIIYVDKAIITGELEVTHVPLFKRVVEGGIGHAKTYGCGMLCVFPKNT